LSRKQFNGLRFLRQRPIDNFIVDFFCPEIKLIIEIDGNSHYHKPEYDFYRQERLKSLGFEVVRYTEGEVLQNLESVHTRLLHVVHCLQTKDQNLPS
jgi:very-short-patch-repair endonuclease